MSVAFIDALRQIEREKDIPVATLVSGIEAALVSAYRKNFGATGNIRVQIDWEVPRFRVFAQKRVVEELTSEHSEMDLATARRYKADAQVGDLFEVEVTPANFGRIAAQTAKQVMMQRIREAEREIIFSEFMGREGELMTGEVARRERRNVYVNLGRVEALLPPTEQVGLDRYYHGARIKVYVLEVRRTTKSPQVVVSRSHPSLVRRLFELEVPEIHEGVVELKSVAREPGNRTKIAVHSHDGNVDPVGACVGHRGSRVQAVVDELNGEKIDIVRWNDDLTEYVSNALSPAQVSQVILNPEDICATVVVPEDQLSLAIGRAGQNVRLAARLTGWRIDIRRHGEGEGGEAPPVEGEQPPADGEDAADRPAEPPLEAVTPDAATVAAAEPPAPEGQSDPAPPG